MKNRDVVMLLFLSVAMMACQSKTSKQSAEPGQVAVEQNVDNAVWQKGKLVIGHEVRTFVAEGDSVAHWIVDKSGSLVQEYDRLTGKQSKAGELIWAELKVRDTGKKGDGFAREYASVYQVEEVGTLSSLDKRKMLNTLTWKNCTFEVATSGNELTITPQGLSEVNREEKHDITGYTVTNAEIGDLNVDGYPEVFVYLTSHGSGSYGRLIGYSVNNGKSMSLVALPSVSDDPKISKGYMGHDHMKMAGNRFVLSFPVYKDSDTNANPTGGTREVHYQLINGEAGRALKVDKVVYAP